MFFFIVLNAPCFQQVSEVRVTNDNIIISGISEVYTGSHIFQEIYEENNRFPETS